MRPHNTYEVCIDNSQVESGSPKDDWDFLPPKKIKDPGALNPEAWGERAKTDDHTDTKREDVDRSEHTPDPDVKKPKDWEKEIEKWGQLVIQNPEHKGEWKPRRLKTQIAGAAGSTRRPTTPSVLGATPTPVKTSQSWV